MLVWWSSLSIVDRRTRSTKSHAVTIIEKAVFDLAAARANAVVSSGGPSDGTEEEEGGDEETGDSEKKAKKAK